MVLTKVKERSRRVKKRVLHTISATTAAAGGPDSQTGRFVVGAVAGALFVVMVWGALHHYFYATDSDAKFSPVPSPMYIFLFTRIFFLLLLLFIMVSMIWSCIESNKSEKMSDKKYL